MGHYLIISIVPITHEVNGVSRQIEELMNFKRAREVFCEGF